MTEQTARRANVKLRPPGPEARVGLTNVQMVKHSSQPERVKLDLTRYLSYYFLIIIVLDQNNANVYRLNEALSGVQLEEEDYPVLVRLTAGTIITITSTHRPDSGLVDINVQGKAVTVFLIDLEARSERVQIDP